MTNPKFNAGVAASENRFRQHGQNSLSEMNRWNMLSTAVRGPTLDDEQCEVLDRMVVAITVADPRIWPLTTSRLAANYDQPGTAVALTFLAMDESPIGPAGFRKAAEFLTSDESVVECPPGFGVKSRPVDERVQLLAGDLDRFSSPAIEKYRATIEAGWPPHISGICAALLTAFGLDPLQIHFFSIDMHAIAFIATVYDGETYGFSPVLDDLQFESD